MVEITKKYKLKNTIRFSSINWIGLWTLYKREVFRFLVVWVQTLLSPIISSLLFLLVLSVAIGSNRSDVLGFPFITFLAPVVGNSIQGGMEEFLRLKGSLWKNIF